MTDLENRLRERLTGISEPELLPPADLLARVRAATRRRDAVAPALVAGAALTTSGLALWSSGGSPARPAVPTLAGSPTAAATTTAQAGSCVTVPPRVREVIAQIRAFGWPSQSTVRAVRVSADGCEFDVELTAPVVDPADREAAQRRWDGLVVVVAAHAIAQSRADPTP